MHVLGTPPAFILSQDQTRHSCASIVMSLRSQSGAYAFELQSRPNCCRCYCCIWLFAETHCAFADQGLTDKRVIDRTFLCVCLTCLFCSAFHSSIVKVLVASKEAFRSLLAIDVVSHIAGALSSLFPVNFVCSSKGPTSVLAQQQNKQDDILCSKRPQETALRLFCSRKKGSLEEPH